MKKIVAYTMVLVTMTLLAGCGKKKVEYVENKNLASDTDGVDAGIMFDSLAEQIGAPERWDGEYEGNDAGMTGIDVAADINLEGISGLHAYYTENIRLTEDYKQNIVETLSEGIVYQYDDEVKPKSYWKSWIEYQQDNITQYEERVNSGQEEMDEGYFEWASETLSEYQENYDAAPDDYMVAEDFSGNEYKITYLGMDYCLSFGCDESGYMTFINLTMLDVGQLFGDDNEHGNTYITWEEWNDMGEFETGEYRYESENNEYVREPEQIEYEVQAFLNGLGIDGFDIVRTYNADIYSDDGNKWRNGCGVVLFRSLDGVYLSGTDFEPEYIMLDYFPDNMPDILDNRDRLERIELSINDKGVLEMKYYFPMEWEMQTEEVQILSFETIQDYLIEYARELEETHPVYTQIELVYCLYSETEGGHEFMIVPAWRFKGQYQYEIMVNAIDGSQISTDQYRYAD